MPATNQPVPRGQRPLALLLWLETASLLLVAGVQGATWLLPAAGLVAVLAGLFWLLPLGLALGLAASAAWIGHFAWREPPPSLPLAYGIVALLIGALLSFLGILFFGTSAPATSRRAAILAQITRLAAPLHFVAAGVLIAAALLGGPWHGWLASALALLTILLGGEILVRYASRFYTPRRHWEEIPAPGAFWFFRHLGPGGRACLPETSAANSDFELRLAEMWMWPTVRRGLPALALTAITLTWLTTAVHEIPAGSLGVRQQFGRWQPGNLPPGLHLSLPWPLGGVESVETDHLREIVLGFQSDPGDAILWERAHYVNEQMSLVGGGDDFLSISVPVLYRVGNPAQFLGSAAAPEKLLRTEAERLLLQLTLHRPAAEIMTTAREALRRDLHAALQRALDARACGLVVAGVYLRDIHPPVTVAPAFQEVVGALEEREAFIHEGEAYRRDQITRARGSATAVNTEARATATGRLLLAEGQTHRFLRLVAAWSQAPALYQWREAFRVLDETLAGAKKTIIDDRLRAALPAQLDLRRVMNPDFVDRSDAPPGLLVPPAARSREAFDLDIDGFLRMDRGEIPAVKVGPDNPDNLLAPTPAPTPRS